MKGTMNDMQLLEQLGKFSGKKKTINDIGLPDFSNESAENAIDQKENDDEIDETIMMGAETLVIPP